MDWLRGSNAAPEAIVAKVPGEDLRENGSDFAFDPSKKQKPGKTAIFRGSAAIYRRIGGNGIEIFGRTNELAVFDRAMERLQRTEERVGDPEISHLVRRFEHLLAGQISSRESDRGGATTEPTQRTGEVIG